MFAGLWKSENGDKKSTVRLCLIVLAAAMGVVLLLWGGNIGQKEEKIEEDEKTQPENELIAYQTYLEERVRTLCESVTGQQNITAVVTLSGTFESVFATESDGEREEYVILGSGASSSALLLSKNAPTVEGVGVVFSASLSPNVLADLVELLSATFHIPSNRIHISTPNAG